MLFSALVVPTFESGTEVGDEFLIIESLLNHHIRDAKRKQSFCAGLDWNPLIGLNRGDGEARFDLNQFSAAIRSSPPELTIGTERLHRRPVGFEKAGAKRKNISGVLQVISRGSVNSLSQEE